MSVGCELPIIDGRQCGIDAFERCAECQRATSKTVKGARDGAQPPQPQQLVQLVVVLW